MLSTSLWIAQGFLALFFLAAGIPKVVGKGIDRWIGFDDVPRALTIIIGISEMCAAAGLLLPMLIGHFEWTTPLAAMGIAVISLMASGFHVRAREGLPALETALWASLAGSIAVGRWGETSTGPSISADTLVPVVAALVPTIIAILVLLARRPVEPPPDQPQQLAAVS